MLMIGEFRKPTMHIFHSQADDSSATDVCTSLLQAHIWISVYGQIYIYIWISIYGKSVSAK